MDIMEDEQQIHNVSLIQHLSLNGEWEVNANELSFGQHIGQGSFGIVRKAIWRGTDVALKIIKDHTIDLTQFSLEMTILSKLHHPNILQVLGYSTMTLPYIIIMEYMCNGSLELLLRRKTKTKYNKKLSIIRDISRGIAYLHNRTPDAIIHRDLKPSNILLSASLKAKIADFGISSIQSKANEFYQMTGETGTYRFMAPEILRSTKYNCKVDVWSFGMIVYNVFVERPFAKKTLKDIIHSIDKVNLNLDLNNVSIDIKTIIRNTLVENPNERWDSLYLVNFCNMDLIKESLKKTNSCCLTSYN